MNLLSETPDMIGFLLVDEADFAVVDDARAALTDDAGPDARGRPRRAGRRCRRGTAATSRRRCARAWSTVSA